jgi:hypothetical protein
MADTAFRWQTRECVPGSTAGPRSMHVIPRPPGSGFRSSRTGVVAALWFRLCVLLGGLCGVVEMRGTRRTSQPKPLRRPVVALVLSLLS